MTAVAAAGRALLVAATVVCLLSMGGAMLFAFPVLVPLHWLAARDTGPNATAAWALLAGMSIFEAGWMLTYVLTDQAGPSLVVGAVLGIWTVVLFVRRGADRAALRVPEMPTIR